MGIDAHALNLLHRVRPLGRTVTLGRMAVHLGPKERQRWTGADRAAPVVYGDGVLRQFGATEIDAIDNSPYEGANIVADLNKPLSVGQYDSVLDFGCMEHIFDVRQALANITGLCRVGGQIHHILPANGFCGHGFYQYSPELFFSYYREVEVHVADLLDTRHWYRVSPPTNGRRVNLQSGRELLVIVSARRTEAADGEIQQSDYLHEWATPDSQVPKSAMTQRRARLREAMFAIAPRLAHVIDSNLAPEAPKALRKSPYLTKIRVR